MQCNTTQTNGSTNRPSQPPQYKRVLDGRKHPIRGLWQATASGTYYAQLAFEDSATGEQKIRRVKLVDKDKRPVSTVAQAVEELARLRVQRKDGDLPVLTRTPRFADYVKRYFEFVEAGQGTKKKETIANERYSLNGWIAHLGRAHLDKIGERHINAYITKRLNAGAHPRTVNLDIVALRNVLKHGKKEKLVKVLPEVEWLKAKTVKRELFTVSDLDKLCAAALDVKEDGEPVTKNGQQLCDFLRLLAYCGAREQEAITLRWQDVDLERGQLTIGATGDTKNSTGRVVDFNPKLRAHLEDMAVRRAPDSQWLFPSPQRGGKDIHARTFRESLKLARAHAARKQIEAGERPTLAAKAFHDLRHHFISFAVMSGIDYMTIAAWVGHRDGGVLVGRVYGHLADTHKKEQAQRLNFGPAIVEAKEAAV
jgi:integrase